MNLKNRDFISLMDFSPSELEGIITRAEAIKDGSLKVERHLHRKTLGLLFSVASTRTRISFQVAARQMGGHAEHINWEDTQLINHESLIDTAEVTSRYLDALIIRSYNMNQYGKGREALNLVSQHANIPIINALDDKDHPCQVMGDLLTMKEKLGEDFRKKHVVFTWGYAKRQKSPGVPHSMLVAASLLGMNITFAYPEGFDLDAEYVDFARERIEKNGGSLLVSNDLLNASEGADVIYVKSWKALNMSSEEDYEQRERIRPDWCVSEHHFQRAKSDAIFMNCLPLIRGEQATADVVDGKHSVLYDQAENRLHIQKAILHELLR